METTYLGIDPDDLDDVLTKVEQSYNITFTTNELRQIDTFGQLCEAVTEKIQLVEAADCTSQQAFYKLRQSLTNVLGVERQTIWPTTRLSVLFPKSTRRADIRRLENDLGFGLAILMPNMYIVGVALGLLLGSMLTLFFNGSYALAGVSASVCILLIAKPLGRRFTIGTVGALAEKMAREHYTRARRDASTVNRGELTTHIKQLFCTDLGIDPDELRPDSVIS